MQLVNKEDVLPEQQQWSPSLDQKDSEPPNIKEEQEEFWSDDEEKPQTAQLHQSQRDESAEEELLSSDSTQHRALKTEADGEDCGGSQPARDSGPRSHLQPHTDDVQQLLVIKGEVPPKQQEWNLSVEQEDIKEEQEKLWISQQGQQLHQLEEADVIKFPFTAVPVKSENDEKPQSSQLHQSQSDESRDAESRDTEPGASSSTVHRTLTARADREDYGRPQPASNSGPSSHLQPDPSGRSSDRSSSGFDFLKNRNVSVSHSSCNTAKKQINCSKCGKVCGHNKYSKQHKGRQASDKPFHRPFRGKWWRQKSRKGKQKQEICLSLNRQMRIHAGEKPFGCPECGKRFGHKGNLNKHMRIHTGQKPFVCSECGKRFGHKGNLNVHMRIHTGQKPFVCSECGIKFGQKGNLTQHLRIHTGQKPFVCSECGKGFGHKGSLNIHMRIHTGQKPYRCSECGERFGHKGTLIRHMEIHTGQKAFGCSECGKRFGRKGSLTRHMGIHTGQKPFRCSECGKRFRHKGSLIRHMRIHTGGGKLSALSVEKDLDKKAA